MSSGSSKQTVGYWYRMLHHFGLCEGPVDALLEMRAGDRTAWRGLATHSQRINVNKPKLWGGEESEGGLVGEFDLMMGEPTQLPNDYLIDQLGEDQPTYRGKVGVVWRGGKWGAMNPYPKPASFKLRRVLEGWDNDTPWYPEKAEIVMIPPSPLALYFALDLSSSMNEITPNGATRLENMQAAVAGALERIGSPLLELELRFDVMIVGWSGTSSDPMQRSSITRRSVGSGSLMDLISWVNERSASGGTYFPAAVEDAPGFFNGSPDECLRISLFVTDGTPTIPGEDIGGSPDAVAAATAAGQSLLAIDGLRAYGFNIDLGDTDQTAKLDNSDAGPAVVQGGEPAALANAILEAIGGLIGMNPIHILYDALTHRRMQGEPVGMINDANWRAAADKLYDEGFGLCTSYEGGPVRDFQRRILDVIAGGMTQSRVDGLYYIDLVRGDYEFESLPIIGPDDIVELTREPSIITEQVNQVSVEWFDPQTKQNRATAPVQSLGAIQAAGRPIPDTREYPEIPEGGLALRVAARDLQAASAPVSRFRITLNRRNFDLRPGRQFRLQYPPEGITDMVCMLATNDSGSLTDGRLTFDAVQDVFGMPSTVYVQPEPGLDVPGDNRPVAPTHQRIIEAPYIELVTTLSRPDLDYLPADAGFVLTMAARPSVGLHYTVATAADGESYQTYGTAEWCPTATIVEAAGRLDTEFTLSGGVDLEDVDVGTWAAWDEEVVRVDAIDVEAGTLTLGRACADTVPQPHDPGSRIWFCGEWVGGDAREYADGETVRSKMLTRTTAAELSLSLAPESQVEMGGRQDRPYPPGQFTINGLEYPDSLDVAFADPAAISVGWAARDRRLQDDQLIDTTAGSIGPEPGATVSVELRDAADDSLFDSATGLASPPAEFSLSGFTGADLRVVVFSVRAGLESWQRHIWDVEVQSPPWTPAEISPVLWLDASDGDTITASGSAVTAWASKGSLEFVCDQGNSAAQPQIVTEGLNGRAVIEFDGSDALTRLTSSGNQGALLRNVSSALVYAVHAFSTQPSTPNVLVGIRTSSTSARLILEGGRAPGKFGVGGRRLDSDSFQAVASAADTGTAWALHGAAANYAAAELQQYINGALDGESLSFHSAGSTSNTASEGLRIGASVGSAAGDFYSGRVAEMLVVHGDISIETRQLVEGYLAHKWGLASTLPGGHPYKDTRPVLE